jgi:hypothetical protein
LALIALAHGVFRRDAGDELQPFEPDSETDLAEHFLAAVPASHVPSPLIITGNESRAEAFKRFTALGADLVQAGDAATFIHTVEALGARADSSVASLVALLGLCHGLFAQISRSDSDRDYSLLKGWLADARLDPRLG